MKKVEDLDRWIANGDTQTLQRFERELLKMVRQEFELVSAHEMIELQRLHDDRHLCAHPAFVAEERLFTPNAELVRSHLRNAVTSVLSQQPVQGKSALMRIVAEMTSDTFPHRQADIERFMKSRYLGAAKDSLVRSLINMLLKFQFANECNEMPNTLYGDRIVGVLAAVRRLRPEIYDATMRERLPRLAASLDPEAMDMIYPVLAMDERAWDWLDEATQLQVRQRLRGRTIREPDSPLIEAMRAPALGEEIREVLSRTSEDLMELLVEDWPHRALLPRSIVLLAEADSFRDAEQRLERLLLPLAPFMAAQDVAGVLTTVADNPQTWRANRTPRVLKDLLEATRGLLPETRPAWQAFVARMPEPEFANAANYGALDWAVNGS